MAIVGAKELAAGSVNVREHKKKETRMLPADEFVSNLRRDVAAKSTL